MLNKYMNYARIYNEIISNRRRNPAVGYTERHHVVPRSLGGCDGPENLVSLTAREHFICHYLLAKMYAHGTFEWCKMNHAFMKMKCASSSQNRYFNSRLYSALAENRSVVMSLAQAGENNSSFGKMWINEIGTSNNRKVKRGSIIPEGWIKGRNVKICPQCNAKPLLTEKRYCSEKCKKEARASRHIIRIDEMPCIGVDYKRKSIAGSEEFIIKAVDMGYSKRQILSKIGLSHGGHNYKKLNAVVTPRATNSLKG